MRLRKRVSDPGVYGNVEVLSFKAAFLSLLRLRLPTRRTLLRTAPAIGVLVVVFLTNADSVNWSLFWVFAVVGQVGTFAVDRLRERSSIMAFSRAGIGLSVRHYLSAKPRRGSSVLIVVTRELADSLGTVPCKGAIELDEFPTIFVSPHLRRVRAVKMNEQWHEAREVAR